jgi:hypothetical protein
MRIARELHDLVGHHLKGRLCLTRRGYLVASMIVLRSSHCCSVIQFLVKADCVNTQASVPGCFSYEFALHIAPDFRITSGPHSRVKSR